MANAVYCRNGHSNGFVPERTQRYQYVGVMHDWEERQNREGLARLAFCPRCGEHNINCCLHCKTTIEDVDGTSERPLFCCACGKPFPWTEVTLASAREYTDDLDGLSAEDKTDLKATFDDLAKDTPRTDLAVSRFMKFIRKIGPGAGGVLKEIITNVATEAAKRKMGI